MLSRGPQTRKPRNIMSALSVTGISTKIRKSMTLLHGCGVMLCRLFTMCPYRLQHIYAEKRGVQLLFSSTPIVGQHYMQGTHYYSWHDNSKYGHTKGALRLPRTPLLAEGDCSKQYKHKCKFVCVCVCVCVHVLRVLRATRMVVDGDTNAHRRTHAKIFKNCKPSQPSTYLQLQHYIFQGFIHFLGQKCRKNWSSNIAHIARVG